MIAADDHGQGGCVQCCAHACLDIGMAGFGVGVDDVGVAHVDDVHLARQIGRVVLMVIGACMAKTEQRRCFAHPARAKACAAAKLRARIKRRAKDRHISVQLAPVALIRALAKG